MGRYLLALGLALTASVGNAQDDSLAPVVLAQCADQVHWLRAESARLLQENARLDQRRVVINDRARALQIESSTLQRDDLRRGIDFLSRRKAHYAEAVAFNADIDRIHRDIAALNTVKGQYASTCAGRRYRHRDFAALTPAQQEAMRIGLTDVVVPYIEPSADNSQQ